MNPIVQLLRKIKELSKNCKWLRHHSGILLLKKNKKIALVMLLHF